MELTPTRSRIVTAILNWAPPEPPTLTDLAQTVGLRSPTVHRHLRVLMDEGIVKGVGSGPGRARSGYRVQPYVHGTWIDPRPNRRIMASWSSAVPICWRFPLVSRVPDEAAQAVLYRFLREADWRGHFHPWLQNGPKAPKTPKGLKTRAKKGPPGTPGEVPWGSRPQDYGVTVVAYGSCARGDAGAKSDLDLLVVQPMDLDMTRPWKDLAAEANLWAERQIDLRVIDRDGLSNLPNKLQQALRREGVTVFSSFGNDGEFIEGPWEPLEDL